jgi:hypothetical protein
MELGPVSDMVTAPPPEPALPPQLDPAPEVFVIATLVVELLLFQASPLVASPPFVLPLTVALPLLAHCQLLFAT